jgi:3-oxoadipate enol-lactonase
LLGKGGKITVTDQHTVPPTPDTTGRRATVPGPTGPISLVRQGAGEPLVLLHPLALSARAWGEFADRLANQFEVIAVDARGHGESGWDGESFTMNDLADDVLAVLDGLSLDRAHLVGMSMGGSAAINFAGRYPGRVAGLVLADTTAWYGPEAPTTWAERAEKALSVPRPKQVPFQVDRWFTEEFRRTQPEKVNRVAAIFLETNSSAHAAASLAMGDMDSRELLANISAPTLVLTGVEDYATPPEMGAEIAAGAPQAEARVLDALRHLSLIERPTLADELVAPHLARLASSK